MLTQRSRALDAQQLWTVFKYTVVLDPANNLSTCIRNDAMVLPVCTSSAESYCLPSISGDTYVQVNSKVAYLIVKPLSAMMEMLGLSSSVVKNPYMRVSSTSDIELT